MAYFAAKSTRLIVNRQQPMVYRLSILTEIKTFVC